MTKFEKICGVALLSVMVLEMLALTVIPVVDVICTGNLDSCMLWAFVPGLAAVARVIYNVMKNWEDIR